MPKSFKTLLAIIGVLFSLCAYAQPQGIKIGSKSSWVEEITFNANARPADAEAASTYWQLLDEQENTITEEQYFHYAYSILTTQGIQEASDLSITFDPSYQHLTFHSITVKRGQETINQLTKNINVIQRETSMDRYLYDGSKTAVVNLRDVRIGDVIEYSYTMKGYNPVHQGHIARSIYFDVYRSTGRYFKRLVLTPSKKYNIGFGGTKHTPKEKKTAHALEYSWDFHQVKAKPYDSATPTWYESGDSFMITDFANWNEVGDWAKQLFVIPEAEKKKLAALAATEFEATNDRDYILKVIRFVQDEVRYLGFESGINSHKPYPPVQVYEQRFGDCKDKSLLLTTLLNARGIDAYPVLVNTSLKHAISQRLPAGNIFDHCVAQINFDNQKIYIDPTISNQGGKLDSYSFPDYRFGLVVDGDVSDLDTLSQTATSAISEIQTIEALSIGGEAMLSMRTVYNGLEADYLRAYFASTPLETIQKAYQEYQANLYPDITKWENVAYTDNREENVFIVEEKYKIPTFWKPVPNEEGKIYCALQPLSLTNYFDIPKNIQQRNSPYYLSYPVDYTYTVTLKLPQQWDVEPVDKVIENDLYQYECTVKGDFTEITRMVHYMTKKDHVPVEQLATFSADHLAMYDDLVYQLTYDQNIANAQSYKWLGVVMAIVAAIGGGFLVFWLLNHYDPAPNRYMIRGLPIGGWLVLVAIGVTLTPLRLLYDLSMHIDLVSGTYWLGMLGAKRYGLAAFYFVAQVYHVLFLMVSVLLVALLYQRRSSFPRLSIIVMITNVIMLTADSTVSYMISDNPSASDFGQIVKPLIASIIWTPYLLLSERVKETFVVRGPNHDEHSEPETVSKEKEEQLTNT